MVSKGFFIQYKFILPETIKHASYTYQKLFRAIYGYTQNVTKSNGKTYHYHRKGVLSDIPYLRPGKNCVIIPKEAFNPLVSFFKTGRNPTHYWRGKGDWKAVYYMDEKNLENDAIIKALEGLLNRSFVLTTSNEHETIYEEMLASSGGVTDKNYKKILLDESEKIVSLEWFRENYSKSSKLVKFYQAHKALKA
ncbi:MAG: hypothetical protein ABID38_02630 [Candidatus Diapherotrites archaeon]